MPTLGSQDPSLLLPHQGAHPSSALTWPPRPGLGSHARQALLHRAASGCALRRWGGTPVRAALSARASRLPGSRQLLPTRRSLLPVPCLWAKAIWSAEQTQALEVAEPPSPNHTMVEPGEQLPQEVLALIFRHLPLKDRAAAAGVCRTWAAAATSSAVWHDTNISCDCEWEGKLPSYLSVCLDHIHNLHLEFEPLRKPSRRVATELLTALAGRAPGLRGLRLECRGEKPLFDAGRDILDAVHILCRTSRELRHLDLRRLPFTLDDALVLQVACGCPELRSLFLDNHTLVNSVGPGSVLKLLAACPRLRILGLNLASLSRAVLDAMAEPNRAPFALLALRCASPEDARASPLPDEAWAALHCRHPGLIVELELEPALPAESVTRVLRPAIPLAALHLNLSGDTLGPLRFAACHYATTLRALEVRASASAELDTALEELAAKCTGLREIHCFCVVRTSVLDAFRAHCPRLRSYTLKLKREPHPWRPTFVR